MRKISIASYSFHGLHGLGAMTAFQYLETVRYRYNVDYADIWNGMLASYDENYLRLLRQQMDERGLKLANLCCDGCHLWGDTEEEKAKQEKLALDCIRAAEILGAETVRIDVGVKDLTFSNEQLDYVARKYERYCDLAAGFGAKLGPENHWGASKVAPELKKLFNAVTSKNFGLLLHMGGWLSEQDDIGELYTDPRRVAINAEFVPYAMHTHLMYEICADADAQLVPLLEGNYQGSWSIECHTSTNEYRNVAYQLANVRRVIDPCDYSSFVPVTIPEGATH